MDGICERDRHRHELMSLVVGLRADGASASTPIKLRLALSQGNRSSFVGRQAFLLQLGNCGRSLGEVEPHAP